MWYRNRAVMPAPNRMRAKLSRFAGIDTAKPTTTLPCDWTAKCYNFGFENGRLTAGAGISRLTAQGEGDGKYEIPEMPFKGGDYSLFVGKSSRREENFTYFALSYPGGLYACPCSADASWKYFPCVYRATRAVPYLYREKDLLLMSGDFDGVMIFDGQKIEHVAQALSVTDLCVHEERVFAVVRGRRNSVWFSGAFDPYDWQIDADKAGYIDFDGSLGEVCAVRSLGEYLFIFCDYGIYRLAVYADQTQFSLKKVYEDSSLIHGASIVDCAGKIAFATAEGLRVFDGYNVAAPEIRIGKVWQSTREKYSGCYCKGVYYLSVPSIADNDARIGGGSVDRYDLICLRMKDLSAQILHSVDLHDLRLLRTPVQTCAVGVGSEEDYLLTVDDSGTVRGEAPTRVWSVGEIDFGYELRDKMLRGVEYATETPYQLAVDADGERREFTLVPQGRYCPIGMRGKTFGFEIVSCEKDASIASPTVIVDILKR